MASFTQKLPQKFNGENLNDDGYVYKLITTVDGVSETYYLQKGNYNIGRDEECDIQLLQNTVSRKHAQIIIEGGGIAFITDNSSINDTFRNGIKLHKNVIYELISDNELIFGDVACKYLLEHDTMENNIISHSTFIKNEYKCVFSETSDDDIIPDTQEEENDSIYIDMDKQPSNVSGDADRNYFRNDENYGLKGSKLSHLPNDEIKEGYLQIKNLSNNDDHADINDKFVALSNDSDIFKDFDDSDSFDCTQNTHNNLEVTVILDTPKKLSPFQDSPEDISNIWSEKEIDISTTTSDNEDDIIFNSLDSHAQHGNIKSNCTSQVLFENEDGNEAISEVNIDKDADIFYSTRAISNTNEINDATMSSLPHDSLNSPERYEIVQNHIEPIISDICVKEFHEDIDKAQICHNNSGHVEILNTFENIDEEFNFTEEEVNISPPIIEDYPRDTDIVLSRGESFTAIDDKSLNDFFTCSDKDTDVKLCGAIVGEDDSWMNFSEEDTSAAKSNQCRLTPRQENTNEDMTNNCPPSTATSCVSEKKELCKDIASNFAPKNEIRVKIERTTEKGACMADIDVTLDDLSPVTLVNVENNTMVLGPGDREGLPLSNMIKCEEPTIITAGLKQLEELDFIDRLNHDVNEDETLTQRLTNSCCFEQASSSQDSIYEQQTQKIDDTIPGTQVVRDDHACTPRECDTQTPTQILSSYTVANKPQLNPEDSQICTQIVLEGDTNDNGNDTPTQTKTLGAVEVNIKADQEDLNTSIKGKTSLSLKKELTKDTKIIFPDRKNNVTEDRRLKENNTQLSKNTAIESTWNIENEENRFSVKEGRLKEEKSKKRCSESIRTTLERSNTKSRVKKLINVDEINRRMFEMDETAESKCSTKIPNPKESHSTTIEKSRIILLDLKIIIPKRKNWSQPIDLDNTEEKDLIPPAEKRPRSAVTRNTPAYLTEEREDIKTRMTPKARKESNAAKYVRNNPSFLAEKEEDIKTRMTPKAMKKSNDGKYSRNTPASLAEEKEDINIRMTRNSVYVRNTPDSLAEEREDINTRMTPKDRRESNDGEFVRKSSGFLAEEKDDIKIRMTRNSVYIGNTPGSLAKEKEDLRRRMTPETRKEKCVGKKEEIQDVKEKAKRTTRSTGNNHLDIPSSTESQITERTRQGRRSSLRIISDSVVIPKTCQHVIMFCGNVDKRYENAVKKLGGAVTDDVSLVTHLVMNKMRRTVKFLCCVTRGVYIVTTEWVAACQTLRSFIPTNSYVLTNGCNKYNLDLQMVLQLSRRAHTLSNGILGHYKYVVFVTENTKPCFKDLEQIISLSGGKCVLISDDNFTEYINETNVRHLCIADEFAVKNDVHPNIARLMARDIDIVSVEFLFAMVLEQKHPEIKKYKMVTSTYEVDKC